MPVSEDWQTTTLGMSDTTQPLIQVRYIGDDDTHTIAIDADGSASELLITLTDDGGAHTVIGNTTTTLQGCVDAINAFTDADGLTKWEARRYNAPADYDTGTAAFIDHTASDVPRTFTNYLQRDASAVLVSSVRLSNPETGDAGDIQLALIQGNATYASGAVTVKVSQDPGAASEEVTVYSKVAAATTVESDILNAFAAGGAYLRVKGPVLVEVTGSAALAACDYRVSWRAVNS